jgi:hypothetical protein
MWRRGALIPLILVAALAMQQRQPIEPYSGDKYHEGQPDHCRNHDSAIELHNCQCQPMAKDGKDACRHKEDFGPHAYGQNGKAKCGTHCRPSACMCKSYCTS